MSHGDRKNDNTAKNRKKGSFRKIQETLRFSLETGVSSCFGSRRYRVKYMVRKLASPPMTLEIGSARKTPSVPKPRPGKNSVRGTTMRTFRSRARKIARFAQPKGLKVDCPANWKAM